MTACACWARLFLTLIKCEILGALSVQKPAAQCCPEQAPWVTVMVFQTPQQNVLELNSGVLAWVAETRVQRGPDVCTLEEESANKPVPPEVKHQHFLCFPPSIAKSNVYCLFICVSVCIRPKLTMNQ